MNGFESEGGLQAGDERRSLAAPRPGASSARVPATRTHVVPAATPVSVRRTSVRAKVIGLGAAAAAFGGAVAGASFVSPALASVVGASGAVAMLAVSVAVSNSITSPLRDVGRQLRRFGDGDLTARAHVANDEIGTFARSFNVVAESLTSRLSSLEDTARQAAHLRAVTDALEMAADETHVYRILEQSMGLIAPNSPAELLIADHGARFHRAAVNPIAGPGGCPVSGPDGCVAMRRAQTMTFPSPSTINACPMLVEHDTICSATCIPVGVHGHLLGVLHVTGREGDPPRNGVVEQFVSIASLVGTRVGSIRALENSRLEASTDGLTGLANRRKLEAAVEELMAEGVAFSLVMADIDHFKKLNDRYGHETGDRALQLFASVLQDNVRGHDIVARFGGEEFVLVYPRLPALRAIEVLDRIRHALESATVNAGLPSFTTSFGVASSTVADSLEDIIRVADAGLFAAKQAGRNRVVFADQALADEIFSAKRSEGSDTVGDGDAVELAAVIDLTDGSASPESSQHQQ